MFDPVAPEALFGLFGRRLVAQLKERALECRLADLMDEAQADLLASMTFPREHRTKLHSANPLERINGEIKRRTTLVGLCGLTRHHWRHGPARSPRRPPSHGCSAPFSWSKPIFLEQTHVPGANPFYWSKR